MKKKKLLALFIVVAMLGTMFVACDSDGGDSGDGGSGGTDNIILATGGTTGTYYSLGGAMAQLINTNTDGINITAQSTGASVENCRLLGSNEAELALLQNDVIDYAYNGIELFDDEIENVRAVAVLYPEIVQIIAKEGIETVEDLRGKRVSVGAAGSGVEVNAKQVFEAAGMTFDDFDKRALSFSESADAFKDNQIDAFFLTAGVPNASVQDITAQHDISVITIGSDIAATLMEDYPFYVEYTIPGGTYNGVDEDVDTVAVLGILATNEEASEDMVYEVTKALFENLEGLEASHAKGEEITLEKAAEGISVPFHPGAEKYLKEVGVMD